MNAPCKSKGILRYPDRRGDISVTIPTEKATFMQGFWQKRRYFCYQTLYSTFRVPRDQSPRRHVQSKLEMFAIFPAARQPATTRSSSPLGTFLPSFNTPLILGVNKQGLIGSWAWTHAWWGGNAQHHSSQLIPTRWRQLSTTSQVETTNRQISARRFQLGKEDSRFSIAWSRKIAAPVLSTRRVLTPYHLNHESP